MPRFQSANDIINKVAVTVGLQRVTDPVASADENFVQLRSLLNDAGEEMVEIHPWQVLRREINFVTSSSDSGKYPLPDDFGYMIEQTGWDRTNNVSMAGPLAPLLPV